MDVGQAEGARTLGSTETGVKCGGTIPLGISNNHTILPLAKIYGSYLVVPHDLLVAEVTLLFK